jgi:G:T-mismatch repair DNA endonuclease (very short patch repair protein)
MKCIICNKEFLQSNHLKLHIKYHHHISDIETEKSYLKSLYSGQDIDFENIKQMYIDGFCVDDLKNKYGLDFRNYIKLLGIKRTASESKKTKIYKQKIESTLVEKYGVNNPSQSEIIKQKKKETFLKNFGYENNFCNQSIREKNKPDYIRAQETMKRNLAEKYGENVTNPAQMPGVRQKISESNKLRMSLLSEDELRRITEKARSSINYVSKQELRIQKILNDLSITYTANGFLYSYNWDLIFKNKIIIEIQGDFWHGNPKLYKESDILLNELKVGDVWKKDLRKKQKVESHNYKVHYLWESDINNMSDEELIETLNKIICLIK